MDGPSAAMGDSLNYQFLMMDNMRLNQTTILHTEGLDKFDAFTPQIKLTSLLMIYHLVYKRSRSSGPCSGSKRTRTHSTILLYIHTTALLLAPLHLLSDVIYKNLTKEESIHFSAWPRKILSNKDIKILSEMQRVREIVEKAHAIKKEKPFP